MHDSMAFMMVGLILTGCINSGLAGRLAIHGKHQRQLQHEPQQQLMSLQHEVAGTGRQADSGSLLSTVISLALKYGPTLFNTFFGGDGAPQQNTDRIEELEIKEEIGRHTSELQSHHDLVCRLLLEKKKKNNTKKTITKKKK